MNAMNRGSLRAIRQMLQGIKDVLDAIVDAEEDKENAYDGGVPIESKHGCYSGDLEEVADHIMEAIGEIDDLIDQEADWEGHIRKHS